MTDKELVKLLIDNTNDWKTQKLLASLGYYPEYFMYSDSQDVRAEVAKRGYGLDVLVNDDNPFVRRAVAEQGYRLDTLIVDCDSLVRFPAASKANNLMALVDDSDSSVRYKVAEEEHCPEDVLIELVKDDDDCVRDAAYRRMRHLVYRRLFY